MIESGTVSRTLILVIPATMSFRLGQHDCRDQILDHGGFP
jgi:hypothetical protein